MILTHSFELCLQHNFSSECHLLQKKNQLHAMFTNIYLLSKTVLCRFFFYLKVILAEKLQLCVFVFVQYIQTNTLLFTPVQHRHRSVCHIHTFPHFLHMQADVVQSRHSCFMWLSCMCNQLILLELGTSSVCLVILLLTETVFHCSKVC